MSKLTSVQVSLSLPYIGGIQGTWSPDENEQSAAWEMYVELVTRISVVELQPDEGLLREALSSLYLLFDTTRKILRKYGPSVARPKNSGDLSFGYLSVAILNTILRPVLSKWHPLLLHYEITRIDSTSTIEHERNWKDAPQLRQELNSARSVLVDFANLLAQVAEVPSLII